MGAYDRTIIDLVDEGLDRLSQGTVIAHKVNGDWQEIDVDAFRAAVRHVALGLHALGLRHGDRFAIHSANRAEWLLADLAGLSLGAVNVPIYATQHPDQARYILQHSEAKVLFVSTPDLFANYTTHLDALNDIALIGFELEFEGHIRTFADLQEMGRRLDEQEPGLFEQLRSRVTPDDLITITYTSGTTGVPKGVMLTHRNIAHSVIAGAGSVLPDLERLSDDRLLSFLPFAHIFEHSVIYSSIHYGFRTWIVGDVDTLADDLKAVRPIHFATVPRLLERIFNGIEKKVAATKGPQGALARWALKQALSYRVETGSSLSHRIADRLVFRKFRDAFGGRVQAITSGGAALAPEIAQFMNAIGIRTGQGYGLTETSPVISAYDLRSIRPASVGRPVRDVEVRIAEDGEILCRGPNVMQGYFKDPDATAQVITPDGWFHTGDIGEIDKDGYLYVTDRKKELFKLSTGKYVAPAPLENRLVLSPYIEQVVVIGNSRKYCGALIVPDHDAVRGKLGESVNGADMRTLIEQEVQRANDGLPHWEQVKRFELLDEPMSIETEELTPTLKRRRRKINERRQADIDRLYAEG